MPSLEADLDLQALYCMFKGEPGTRKTTQAISFPLPIYIFDWDQKRSSAFLPAMKWGIDVSQIHGDDYSDYDAARIKMEKLQVNCPYKTLILDSITSVGDWALRQAMKAKTGKVRQSGQRAGIEIGGIQVNELEDYKAESAALLELVALTKDIHKFYKVNIIFIAHVLRTEFSQNGETQISRSIVTAGKKVAAKLPAYMKEVYHFNVSKQMGGGTYGCLTTHTGDDFARTILPLPDKIEFGDKPLYPNWIKPAMDELRKLATPKPITEETQKVTPFKSKEN